MEKLFKPFRGPSSQKEAGEQTNAQRSARQQEIDDALSFGSVFIRACEMHRN